MTLIANTNTGIFCLPDCGNVSGGAGDSRAFETGRDALAAGFRPCKKCTPLKTGCTDPDWVPPLMSEVETDPARRWHDRDLEVMGLDPVAVRHWFIANHGLTFHAYTRLRRLGLALRQIQRGAPVTEAVAAHGFDSESSFREAFI